MKEETERPTVMVSGGFDPVHVGHIRMITAAAKYGDVIIVANSDNWLFREKGFVFMSFEQRKEILNAIKGVILVDSVDDDDGTVCTAILRLRPTYFANGGDRSYANTPEVELCNDLNVELLWGIGGSERVGDSKRFAEENKQTPLRASTRHSER